MNDICIVIGATGSAGPELVRLLVTKGYSVRAIARAAPSPHLLPPEVQLCLGDILDPAFLRRSLMDARYVFHLAAKLHVVSPTVEMKAEYCKVNVEATQNIVNVCRNYKVEHLVYFSTVNVYGHAGCISRAAPGHLQQEAPHDNGIVDEDTIPRPCGIYAETKRQGEEVVVNGTAPGQHATRATVLRFGTIYGPHMKGNFVRLVRALAHGRFILVGNGANRRTVIYEEDAARAACLAAEHPGSTQRTYNVSDGKIHTVSEILSAICSALGRRPPRAFVPASTAKVAAHIGDMLLLLLGRPAQLRSTVEKLIEDMAVRSERIQRELGFTPRVNLQQGWARTLERWSSEDAWAMTPRR